MANVRVAVRVRPLSKRETKEGGRIIVEVDGKVAKIRNLKVDSRPDGFGDSREKVMAFGFDYCYWSVNPEDPQYASQDVVFQDLGMEVLSGVAKGYNICLFAYGQTGSGKTYTMLGTPASVGLTPRICEGLFIREKDCASLPSSCRIKVSFLEIYNERVRDLLKQSGQKKPYTLRVREHPEMGPYVQGLSQHVVTNYKQVIQLLEEGIANRITAATHVHDASSRSHAIFTIHYTQAILENNLPSEMASKINLVDLAGSERADPSYCKDRITEGANINKSLVTLGIVISTLAQNSQVFSSCQSLNSSVSNGGDSGILSSPSGTSSGGAPSRRQSYIPYRDSVLTWLLKDSLGGNSKTIMVATVSPAHTSYSETMSTLRYASSAKNIINKPRVNEDANVKLIRELREEIERLKALLLSFELRNFGSLNDEKDENLKELVLQNELKIDQLTKDWTQKWNDWQALMEHYSVDINRRRAGVVIDSSLPHLMALEDDVLSTGVVLYHLKEGTTKIGRIDSDQEQDIVLQGQWIERDHCTITSACGVVVLQPARGARCTVNGREVTASCRLTQGAVITLGKAQKFRFNHPAEAAVLRQRRQVGEAAAGGGSLEWLDLDGDLTASRLGLFPLLWKEGIFLSWDPSTTLPPMPDPTHQTSEKTSSEECLSQAASYPPRIGCLRKNGLHSSGHGQPCTARAALSRKGASAPDTWLTVSPNSVGIQDMERVGKQPHQMVIQGLASLRKSANKLKPRHEPKILTSTTQTRGAKGLADPSHTQAGWRKEGNLGTHTAPKGASCNSPYPHGPRQTAGHGKAVKTFWTEYKPPSLSRASKRHQRVLAARVRNITKKSSHLPLGSPLKRQQNTRDLDTMAPLTDFSPVVDHSREDNDFSDSDSNYSVDSLSCVYAKALIEPLKPEDPQDRKWDFPEPENSESDDSQISEDSLAEKRYQSPQNRLGGNHPTNHHGHPRTRARASVRGFTAPSDSDLLAQTHRSFSLDSLIDAEEELAEDQQEEPFPGSADEIPTETFWHLEDSNLPVMDQEAICWLGPINYRTAARLDAVLPMSSSFYLDPQFQPRCELPPHCEQAESQGEPSYSEQANSLQGMQLSRESPLMSMDSWFSCDSKINPSSPPGIVGSLCPSPDVQEFHHCKGERPGYWLNTEELKPSDAETVLPYSSKLHQGSTELLCIARDEHTASASDTSRLSLWGIQKLIQPGADGTFQGRCIHDTTQQGSSEASHNSSVSNVLSASATTLTHVGGTHERDWSALQQKYLLELSRPVLEAIGAPRPAFPYLEEDSGSLAQASGEGGDTPLPVGPKVSSNLNLNNFPIHLSRIRRLRAEKEQDSLNAKLEGVSDFFSTSEKEVSYDETYSADLESLAASRSTNAQFFAVGNTIPDSMTEACEVKQNNLEECLQSCRKPGLMTSSDEYFFQKNACHSNVTTATKADHWPQGWSPLRKNSAVQPGQLSPDSQYPLEEEKTDCQESSKEAVRRHINISFAFPSGPELYLHSAAWNPLSSSLQPPLLETFYVTKSRDALTETALEIPACREVRVPSPPPREAWGFGHNRQALQDAYLKNNLPVLLQNQNSKVASSQQVTAEIPVDLNTGEVIRESGKCPGNITEESRDSVYSSVTQNRHFLPSTSTKVCEFENQVGILNKHSFPALEGGEVTAQSCCSVSSDSTESGKPLLLFLESEACEEEELDQNTVLRQTINVGLEKDLPWESAVSLKSRSVHHRVSSPGMVAQDESPTPKWEGKNETRLLEKALHPKDSSEEFKLPGTKPAYERFQLVTCPQERNPGECKGPGKSQEMLNPNGEPSEKKQNKRVNNTDEMARLIRSVMQLENGILEIESKQNKQVHASHTPGVNKESVFQDQKEQEKTDHALRPDSSGNLLTSKDQPSSPRQTDATVFRDSEAGEMEVNSTGNHPQVQKITLNPFRSREGVQESGPVREHTHLAGSDRLARDIFESLEKHTTCREFTNTSFRPQRMKALTRALPLQPRLERSSENNGQLVKASASLKEQPWGLGSLEELETVKGFQESQVAEHLSSSNQEEPKAQGKVEEMPMQRGRSLQEENKVTHKLPSLSQLCRDTFFSQETISPLLSWTEFSTAPPHQDLSNTLPLNSPRWPRSCLHVPGVLGISSLDCVLDLTMLKIHNSPLVTGVHHQDQSTETRGHSPEGNVRGGSSEAHTAWCGSVRSMAMRSHSQSGVPESISLGTEDKISASTSPQDHGKDLRITLLGFSTSEDFASEAEVAVQKEIGVSSLNKVSSQPEKRVSFSLEKDNDQASKPRQKAEKETEDLGLTSSVSLAPVSLPRVPSLEPRLLEPSDYASMCLAILEEIRQAKAQRKQLNDFVARGTVLSYCETLLEPECPSGVAGGPQCKQIELSSSDQTRNEGEAPGFHVASLSAEAGQTDLSTDERKVQATPPSADSFQSLPNTETDRQPWDPMQAFSHAAPALDKKHCAGELRQFAGTSEPFICHSDSSEILEKKKDATRTPSSVDPLAPDSLLSSASVEGVRRVVSKQVVAALSSQAPCDDPRVTLHELSQSVPQETAEGIPAGSQDSSPEHQEPRALNTTYGEVSGNSLVTAQEEKTAHFESQSVTCDVQNSTSPSGPKQDHVQCPEASTGFEEGRANPKQDTVLPGALTGVELEAPTQQCVKWKESVGSGLTEICRAGSKHSRPTPLPDQRPSPNPEGIGEGAPCRYPREALHGPVFSRNPEGSRTLSASRGKESRTLPCRQPCSSQPVATRSYSCHSSTLLCCRGGDLGKEPFKAALRTVYPPCGVPSRVYEMDETGETSSRGPDVLLTHGLEPKDVNREFGITESSTCEPSTVAAILSGAQGCRSPSASDVRRTSSFSHSATDGSLGLIGAPEKKVAENQASTELEATSFPAGMYSEPLRQFRDSSVGDQNAQVSQTSPEPPATTPGPHTLDLSEGSVENKLVAEPRHECFENTTRCFLEKPQFSTELRDHDCLDSQAKFVARLKHTCSPQEDSRWQEEEQHRDQASGGGEGFTQGMNPLPSDEGGLDSCQILDIRRQEVAVAKPPVSKILSQGFKDPATVSLRQNETPQPVSQGPGNLYTGREQPALNHRGSLPVTAIFSGPERSKSSPTPQISVVSSSRSLQELNLSVEPPSPTDEDTQGPDRLWNPHLRGYSTGKSMARTSLRAEDSNQKASSHLDDGTTDHRPLKPATPPYPVPSTLSHMPTPDFMTSWMSGTLEQGQQGKPEKLGVQVRPENWCSQMDKGMLHFGSSDISPYALPWRPEEHARIGWKQYVFGSTVDVSCSQKPQGLTPSNVARCSSMDNGLEDQNSPLHSHLSTYANIRDLSTTHSSTENAQGSNEAWEVFPGSSSVSLGDPHILTSSEGVAPTLGHDRRPQFRGPSGEADCLRSKPPLAEGSAAGPADEIMLPYPSGAGCPVGQTRMNIFEQGTQTLGSRCHQSSTDISFAQPEATAASASDLASWTSMHNLSLHLSQLLHSTSELLGSLSQPGVARREQNTKRDIPDKAPQALMMDGSTQTTVDEGSQTDLASPTLRLQASEAEPQGANVILEGLGSHTSTLSQEEGDVPGVAQKREAEETAQKMAQLLYLQEESTPYKPQNPSTPSSHLRFQKAPLRQHLPSVGPSVSDAFLPPSSQPEESSCIAVSSPSPSPCHSPGLLPSTSEYPGDPRVQKKLGPTSALLVDRASSPILTLSASTQELGLPPGSLTLSAPSAHPVEGHQKLDSSPDPVGAPRTPMDNYSQTTDELGGSQRGGSVLQRSNGRSFLELHSPHNPQQSPKLQFSFLGQHPQQLQPSTTIGVQSRLLPPPLRHRSQTLADSFVPEEVASPERGPLSGKEPSQWRSRTENGGESSASPGEPQRTLDRPSSCGGLQHLSPCPVSELTDTAGLRGSALGLPQACQPEGLLCSSCQMCMAPEPQHHSLRDLPAHNKFSNWCGVQKGMDMTEEELGASGDLSSEKQEQSTPQPPNDHSQDPEWSQREQIPLQVGAQNLSLSVELTEAKLHHGFGEADALLQVLQSGTGEALAADEPVISTWKELHARQKKAIETLRRERAERLGNFCRTRSLSPQKQLSLLPNKELFVWDLDLPSRRREYLQQLRKDVVETTRSPESVSRSAQPPSDIELMLRDYQQAHEEAKEEIARARDQLREQTEQEKLRIHQQIVSQLLREEDKLHTLATSSSLCTSSNGSLSSGMTSGYNSSPALSGQLQAPENAGYTNLPDSRDVWIGDERGGLSAVRKNSAYGRRASLGSCCCSPSSLSNSGTCFSSSYQDLAKHVVDTSMADVMAACSDNLHNLFSCQATAGWNYQGEEQAVQLYYKVFSSTRHGFLGAGVVSQPLSHVWAAVSDPSLWPLYYKPIQTARLHQRVTNSISLVYLVCNTTLCALKQPRDFCCVCVEAKEGHLSVMAAQSVYDTSMPRPSRKMVRGEILPSAWILQPVTVEGKEVTRVIYLAQVELGAPGFPPQLLSSFIKQQPLVIARLASFLGS
ncbi:PREDICTED: stAR-related lipid transfer protein 9 isoform X7 [Cercocebus atys]|uniref:stAR-related lipid transfer protein 9 isoform X7 n=1 Tax=Cercocebus atys TaxID=9531 RepID=UPI0005F36E6F|nr:PREDICTED: stAR-related lipid transfer protein 9 isoform X7 [Cercocebus atys]